MRNRIKVYYRNGNRKQKGFVLMMMTLGLMFFVSTVGLGVDAGVIYVIRARLQAAADGSALAAARVLNTAADVNTQEATAKTTGENFFKANFPPGLFNTTGSSTSMSLAYGTTADTQGTFFITSNAATTAPTYFMRVFGKSSARVTAKAISSRRDINVILVLDRSASMTYTQPGTSQTACTIMKSSAKSFVDMFSSGRDKLGLVTFGMGATVNYAPNSNFTSGMKSAIDALSCNGYTNTGAGLRLAWEQLQTIGSSSKLNVIVLFTDGLANGVVADLPVKMLQDQRLGDGNSGYSNNGTTYTMPPSPCKDANGRTYSNANWNPFKIGDSGAGATNNTIRGTLVPAPTSQAATGDSSGVYAWDVSGTTVIGPSNSACGYRAIDASAIRRDVAYIPSTDIWGNSTTGFRTDYNYDNDTYQSGIDKFPSGHPYQGRIRIDRPRAIWNAAANVVDSQGSTIRANTVLNPMISTIGLGGNTGTPADAELLIRLANLPSGLDTNNNLITNGGYDSTRPQGSYVYAPSSNQLAAAFVKVASFVAELAY